MRNSRGIALLTVLVILTLLVIFATAFIQVVRTEVQSTENFKNSLVVQDVAKTGVESLRQEFASLAYGRDGIPFTGDEIRPYVSLLDSWSIGKVGVVDQNNPRTVYDLRPWLFNQVLLEDLRINQSRFPVLINNGAVWEVGPQGPDNFANVRLELIARRGVDEDPPGDFYQNDVPGLAGVDDDFDGVIDIPASVSYSGEQANDDDEDGLIDEDGIDLRREILGESLGDRRLDNLNLAWDADQDYTGIDPNAGRINIASAGNRNGIGGRHAYHLGIHPIELDLEVFCSLMLGIPTGLQMAQAIVAFREGPDGGPGVRGEDDNFNSVRLILGPPDSSPNADPNNVLGNGRDDDRDGLTDEEDEHLAGTDQFYDLDSGQIGIPSDLRDNRGNRARILTNGVDDGGIAGVIDDVFELDDIGLSSSLEESHPGIDDFLETRPRNPFGDDSPPQSRFSLRIIPGMEDRIDPDDPTSPTPHQLLERFLTVESTSNRFRKETLLDTPSNRNTINPNLILLQTPFRSRKPLNYLYPLIGLDNDGDWGTNLLDPAVPGILEAATLRDDLNGNHIPDGDWDGEAEITSGPESNNIDDDLDGAVDDTGDANRDGHTSYDPEGRVDEDPVSFKSATQLDRQVLGELLEGGFLLEQTRNQIQPLFRNPRSRNPNARGDRVDNNSNRTRWMSDGIDNDGDGLTDETYLDEMLTGIPYEEARDEGVDEPGEFYILSWDEEAFDGIDNDRNSDDWEEIDGILGPTPGDWGVDALGRVFADGIDNDGDSEDYEDLDGDNSPSEGDIGVLMWDGRPYIYADGIDNNDNSDDYEDLNNNNSPDPGEPGVNKNGKVYADGLDNDDTGLIDDNIDEGIDEGIDMRRNETGGIPHRNPQLTQSFNGRSHIDEILRTVERNGARDNFNGRYLLKHDEDPLDIQFVANLADALDYSLSPEIHDGASKVQIRDASQIHSATRIVEAWGNEAIRITEVMARPLIRLQPEGLGINDAGNDWALLEDNLDRSTGLHFVKNLDSSDPNPGEGEWVFRDIPEGEYWVAVYAFFSNRVATGRIYSLEGATGTVEGSSGEQTLTSAISVEPASTVASATFFPTQVFRNAFFDAGKPKAMISEELVGVGSDGNLTVRLTGNGASNLSFDYVELYAPKAQYLEMCNFGERPIPLAGWEIRLGGDRIVRIDPDSDKALLPGQFAVVYGVEKEDDLDLGPSGIRALRATQYPNSDSDEADPLVLTQEDMVTGRFQMTASLEEVVFGSDEASIVELWAPRNVSSGTEVVFMDAFHYNSSSDFCSPVESYKRQETYGFAPQHRGDPTRSLLRQEAGVVIGDETYTVDSYVHGPMRFLAEDAVVTIAPPGEAEGKDGVLQTSEVFNAGVYKPVAIVGRHTIANPQIDSSSKTEYGEILFEVSERVRDELVGEFSFGVDDLPTITFHWPGLLNHFRDPKANDSATDQGEVWPVLYVRAGGVSGRPIGIVDFDPTDAGSDERLAFHGDLLYVIDPNGKSLTDLDNDYADILDTGSNSLRVSLRVRDGTEEAPIGVDFGAPMFAYVEISPGVPDGKALVAGDPGREHFYYPDGSFVDPGGSRFLYMERRRRRPDPPRGILAHRFQRSLRFREGPMSNCSPYLAGANGRNIEKYSMGRGVFSGPTPREMAQIASRMEFHSDPVVDGLLNVNVADQKVLCALPFFPPESADFGDMRSRLWLGGLMSQVIVMGRSQRGFDGEVGRLLEVGGPQTVNTFTTQVVGTLVPQSEPPLPWPDRFSPRWAPSEGLNGFGEFNVDDNGDGIADDPLEYKTPGSDDGPFTEVGDMAVPFLSPLVIRSVESLNGEVLNLKPPRWTETGVNSQLRTRLDESDLHIMLGRIMNLSTIQANEFTVISRARVIHTDTARQSREVLAEQKLEENFSR